MVSEEMSVDEAWDRLNQMIADGIWCCELDKEDAESILDAAQLETSAEGIIQIAAESNIILGD